MTTPSQRRAVIDVGTNSVKLLVAQVSGRRVDPLLEQSEQTRLGSGFYATQRLQPATIARTARAVAEFARHAARWNAVSTRVIATSAARDALNQDELLAAIRAASGLAVEVISGEQEADWAFRGVDTTPLFAGRPLLIVEVGGGSTQVILGEGGHPLFGHSFRLGTVRLMEQLPHSDPPTPGWERCRTTLQDFLEHQFRPVIDSQLRTFSSQSVQLVGTGGTASVMARIELGLPTFDREQIEALPMTLEHVRQQRERLWSLPLAERRRLPGLPANRADVILTGVAIYQVLMELLSFPELRISTRGLRFAAVLD